MEENVELTNLTTFKIGGLARYFFRVKNVAEAREALGFARHNHLPFFVLGGGSNLLVSDKGFAGVVIKNEILGVSFNEKGDEVLVTAGAGESWDQFVKTCVDRRLYGVENLSGIPGTVGAAPVQNIGAYGVEAKDSIISVEALDTKTGESVNFASGDCQFAYRHSFFKTAEGKRYVIVGVTFCLRKQGVPSIEYKDLKQIFNVQFSMFNEEDKRERMRSLTSLDVRKAVLEIRAKKFPDLAKTGTAGSFFKNPIIPQAQFDDLKKRFPNLPGFPLPLPLPLHATRYTLHAVKVPLAWILDNILHLKGFVNGRVGLHDAQPLVIVQQGGGTAEEVCRLAEEVAGKVKDATGILLEWEVEKI